MSPEYGPILDYLTEDEAKIVQIGRNRCPICGHDFDPVLLVNVCPTEHYGEQVFTAEQLISDDADYAWCL